MRRDPYSAEEWVSFSFQQVEQVNHFPGKFIDGFCSQAEGNGTALSLVPSSFDATAPVVSPWIVFIIPAISFVALVVRSASLRTSSLEAHQLQELIARRSRMGGSLDVHCFCHWSLSSLRMVIYSCGTIAPFSRTARRDFGSRPGASFPARCFPSVPCGL